ncbi:pentatricopeptide repeat-containing protein At1g09410, mitochondrial-like [Solanum dulcamara]|uniref:pentatricopeptide repeat-containing protein At1g09410, mitochondrial-like n=1 Tax=Solanum dulcamara TaxID=45834 RepID=UPI002485ADC5|nr:pentatricopeptide repeat-containing protein At1g09410, mitochondrial-like [Solanum dulcamara]
MYKPRSLIKISLLSRQFLSRTYSKPKKQIPLQMQSKPHLEKQSIFSCNKMIMSLSRQGKVEEARQLFDEMPQRDVVSYASMITVYLKHKELPKAERLFYSMPERNVVSDSAMVHAYAKAGRIDEGRRIFDLMPDRNVYAWTSLISGYFQNRRVDEAQKLLQQMPEKNVVTWTTAMVGYAQNGLITEARRIFDQIPEKNVIVWTAMIRAFVENHQIDQALELFDKMPERNLYSWNVMIQGCLNDNRVTRALELFNAMPCRNAVSWTTIVTGLARNGMIEMAREYFDQMPNRDPAAWNAMITAYVDEGLVAKANELFDSMPNKDLVSWNVMIDGYAKIGLEGEALKRFILMLQSGLRPNQTTLTSVVTSCGGILELMQAHVLVLLLGFDQDTSLNNALVTMYSRCGDINSSLITFDNLKVKDVVSWTAIILAYANHGLGNQALQAFSQMLRSGNKPDEITFVGLLSACSHAGLVKKGQKFFESMRHAYDLKPRAEHYCCLVDILGRGKLVDEAIRVVHQMPPEERDGAVLGALLGACKLYGDVGAANQICDEILELEPGNSGAYVLMANTYAASGRWGDFAQVRKKMKERKVKKVPGFSEIEVNGKNHIFFVGDKSHPEKEEIYTLIKENLLPLMQEDDLEEYRKPGIEEFHLNHSLM